jgi:hypothetical protein
LVEQLIRNQQVVRSIRIAGSKLNLFFSDTSSHPTTEYGECGQQVHGEKYGDAFPFECGFKPASQFGNAPGCAGSVAVSSTDVIEPKPSS